MVCCQWSHLRYCFDSFVHKSGLYNLVYIALELPHYVVHDQDLGPAHNEKHHKLPWFLLLSAKRGSLKSDIGGICILMHIPVDPLLCYLAISSDTPLLWRPTVFAVL